MKVFTLCIVVISVVAAANSQKIKPNEDCSCKGYEALSASCKDKQWPASLKKCVATSKAYESYKEACEWVNKYREEKRNGTAENIGTRKITCEAWKSFDQRRKEKCGSVPRASPKPRADPLGYVPITQPIADSIDWTSSMTPVKDQGACGSCWAFATIALCEWYLKNKSTTPAILSEQTLVDCNLNNKGCNGGWQGRAMSYIAANGSASSEYPYTATRGACKIPSPYAASYKCPPAFEEYFPNGNDTRLRQVLNVGPVTVSLHVANGFFQVATGIYSPTDACTGALNHAVVIVGYGSVGTQKYWIIRNSWGTSFGEGGYAKMDANKINTCGLSTWLVYFRQP